MTVKNEIQDVNEEIVHPNRKCKESARTMVQYKNIRQAVSKAMYKTLIVKEVQFRVLQLLLCSPQLNVHSSGQIQSPGKNG